MILFKKGDYKHNVLTGFVDVALPLILDTEGLRRQSEEGAKMGFTGKQVIHPSQISIVQECFTPSPEKVEWATELIKGFKAHQAVGKV